MGFHLYRPCHLLAPYVKVYWEVQHDLAPGVSVAVPFSCTGLSHLVFSLQTPFQCTSQGKPMPIEETTLFVQNTLPLTNYFSGPNRGLIVDFTPTGLHTLWQLPMIELGDQSLDAQTVMNRQISELTDQLREARSTGERIGLVETFLLRRLKRVGQFRTDGRIETAVSWMQRRPGYVNLSKLAHTINVSERTLRRRFVDTVGVSPKHYLRMQRFITTRNRLTSQVQSGGLRLNWQALIEEVGYYDQAHLINEFNYFMGIAPRQFAYSAPGLHDFFYQAASDQ